MREILKKRTSVDQVVRQLGLAAPRWVAINAEIQTGDLASARTMALNSAVNTNAGWQWIADFIAQLEVMVLHVQAPGPTDGLGIMRGWRNANPPPSRVANLG